MVPGPGSGGGGAGLGGAIFTQGSLVLSNVRLVGNAARGGSVPMAPENSLLPADATYAKAGGGGGGLSGHGAAGTVSYQGGGGGGFGPSNGAEQAGGAGPNQTEGGTKDGRGGSSRRARPRSKALPRAGTRPRPLPAAGMGAVRWASMHGWEAPVEAVERSAMAVARHTVAGEGARVFSRAMPAP